MKKILFTLCLATSLGAFSQSDSVAYRNEFGIDATGFIQKFLTFKNSDISNSYYYLTYRRHFAKGNLRTAIGGNLSKNGILPYYELDNNVYYKRSASIKARIGWEFRNEISKRWQVFTVLTSQPPMNTIKTMYNPF